jgi:hypothetical protein
LLYQSSSYGDDEMTAEDASTAPSRPRRRFWGWKGITTIFVFVAIAWAVAYHFRFHALWIYESNHLNLGDVTAIPNQPMPGSATPGDWVRCRANAIEVWLPPELARNMVAPKNGATAIVFKDKSKCVIVDPPSDIKTFTDLLDSADKFCPVSHRPFTLPGLRLCCYGASSNDFRWSMSPAEARWHAFRITTRRLMQSGGSEGHTESLERVGFDGIIDFKGERASFDWQSSDPPITGYVNFVDESELFDPSWIRAACQSLRVPK